VQEEKHIADHKLLSLPMRTSWLLISEHSFVVFGVESFKRPNLLYSFYIHSAMVSYHILFHQITQ
jgi:hypothetical protein